MSESGGHKGEKPWGGLEGGSVERSKWRTMTFECCEGTSPFHPYEIAIFEIRTVGLECGEVLERREHLEDQSTVGSVTWRESDLELDEVRAVGDDADAISHSCVVVGIEM